MKKRTILFLTGLLMGFSGYCQSKTTPDTSKALIVSPLQSAVAKYNNYHLDDRTAPVITDDKVKVIKAQKSDTAKKKAVPIDLELRVADYVIDPNREDASTTKKVNEVVRSSQEEAPLGKRIINGPSQFDSRIELLQLDPKAVWQSKILKNSVSVAIVVDRSQLHLISDSVYQLDIEGTLGAKYNLCAGEAFFKQPVAGSGTAFMIGTQKMVTAGHVFTGPLSNYAIIFDFQLINKSGGYSNIITLDHIFFPQSILASFDDLDIAIFTVDRPTKRPALKFDATGVLPNNTDVYMIGHPYGLPMKVAANASVQKDAGNFFYTTLDAFQGNSGSPVFRLDTHEVIGILVSGGTDYTWNGTCNVSTICEIPYCDGEKAVKISVLYELAHQLLNSP